MIRTRLFATAAALLVFGVAVDAHAGGFYYTDRGVRPMGRGGAFVAGADDLNAAWYNPAGLAEAGSSLFLDLAWVNQTTEFTRKAQVIDGSGTVQTYGYPTVKGTSPFLTIPMLGGSYNFGQKKEFTVALATTAPYSSLITYPVTVDGQPAASRYSAISLDGTALLRTGAYFAYKPIPQFRIGVGLEAVLGAFQSTLMFGAAPPDRLVSAPEDPNYDTLSQLKGGPIFAPTGSLGVQVIPEKHIAFGLSGQLPTTISTNAAVKVRLPNAAPFDKAYQEGDQANVRMKLPAVLRVGAEFRQDMSQDMALRVELAYVREFWSAHESIDIRSENIKLYNLTGFPSPFGVAPISLPRNFQDSNSFRLGGELRTMAGSTPISLRLGGSYDTSAIPLAYVSPLTTDADKIVVTAGAGVHLLESKLRIDMHIAKPFAPDLFVPPGEAKVPRVNPVQGNPTQSEAINGGNYVVSTLIIGLGANYKF
jgi:long-chain fatty acid transport protein